MINFFALACKLHSGKFKAITISVGFFTKCLILQGG